MASNMQNAINALGEQFGRLDNQVEKWIDLEDQILALLPSIQEQMDQHFPVGSLPIEVFTRGKQTYLDLLESIPEDESTANGYLNLRFYIMLNGFLAACRESLDKVIHNESLDAAALVEKSYYTPYFFERVTYSNGEILDLLEEDIQRLENAPPGQKGLLLALRIRKGTSLTLTESFCPLHPRLYPLVAELEQVPVSKDPALISTILEKLKAIREAIS